MTLPRALSDRDGAAGLAVALFTLTVLLAFGTEGSARWPWVGFLWLAAVPFVALLVPEVQRALREALAARPALAGRIGAGLVFYGVTVAIAGGTGPWYNLLLWPVCIAIAMAGAGAGGDAEPSGGRLLLSALGIWALAGLFDRALRIRVPGGTQVGLAYLAAIDLGLFLFLVVRPLKSFDVRVGLRARELGIALLGVAALVAFALPLGLAIGFLRLETRWEGTIAAAARLIGLILFVGLPEELLFRGLMQEGFSRLWTPRIGLVVGSVVFGLSHIVRPFPNWRYALLATFAGLAYGWVYQRTRKLSAAAVTHGTVDWIWSTFLHS